MITDVEEYCSNYLDHHGLKCNAFLTIIYASKKYDLAAHHPEVILQINELVKAHNEKLVKGEAQLQYRGVSGVD